MAAVSRMRRIALIAAAAVVVLAAGGVLVLRSLLEPDTVRAAIEKQGSLALGQPVHVGAARAGIWPSVGVKLSDVKVGDPARLTAELVHVETGLRGLLSRRVENAVIEVRKARIKLPLAGGGKGGGAVEGEAEGKDGGKKDGSKGESEGGFTIASVKSIEIEDLQIERGSQSLGLDLSGSLDGEKVEVSRLALSLGKSRIRGTASFTSYKTLDGSVRLEADPLDLDALLAFGSVDEPAAGGPGKGTAAAPARVHLSGDLKARRGTIHGVDFESLEAGLLLDGAALKLDPLKLSLLGGHASGSARIDGAPGKSSFAARLAADDIDLAALAASQGSKGAVSGRLKAGFEVAGNGASLAAAGQRAAGTANVHIADLDIRALDLVGTALRFLGSGGSGGGGAQPGELKATARIAGGRIQTDDARLVTRDLEARAEGALSFAGALDFRADCLLSEAISAGVKGDASRYAKEGNRLVLPMKVTGTVAGPEVSVDAGAVARRAVGTAVDEAKGKAMDQVGKELGGLFGRKK